MRKWIVLAAGVVLQAVLGGIYAWSAFVPPLVREYGLSKGQCGLIFGLTIAVFTVVMIPAGRMLRRTGPRIMAGLGAVLFGAGHLVASISDGNYLILLLGIGCLAGAGIGAGYVCPLTVAMKWFPRNRGLVTGVAVAGFGGGAIVLSFLVQFLLTAAQWDALQIFRFVGIVYGLVALGASLLLSEPATAETAAGKHESGVTSLKSCIRSGPFALLCLGMFASTFAGLLAVGNLKPIILEADLSSRVATLGISIFAVGNAAGRIIWGQVHDRMGSRPTVLLSLLTLALALSFFLFSLPAGLMLVVVMLSGIGFGACFVVYASAVVHTFGVQLFPYLYPICFLGYGVAGLTGPGLGGWVADTTGSFAVAILISLAIIGLAFITIMVGLVENAVAESAMEQSAG